MPHVFADRPGHATDPAPRDPVASLITQARRLRGEVDAARRGTPRTDGDARGRWQHALYDLALHHLSDLDEHLAQLNEEPPDPADFPEAAPFAPPPAPGPRHGRTGSAEWNLLTDEAHWSAAWYEIVGLDPSTPALTLDELPSLVRPEDHPLLTTMVTGCLIDGRPLDGEFRIRRPDGTERTVHMTGEPVLDADGSTAAMWAVLHDVTERRHSERALHESHASFRHAHHVERAAHQAAVDLQEAVLPPWGGPLRLPHRGPGALDLAAHYLPSATGTLVGGDWYDALELPDSDVLLSIGDLTGHGVPVTSGMALLLGALRATAVSGTAPGPLLGVLNHLLDASVQPALGSTAVCRYRPASRTLTWAQAGHPAPLLFRDGTGRVLPPPDGVLLGASSGARYGQSEVPLHAGDLLLLHTDGLVPRRTGPAAHRRLLALAPRLAAARSAQECVRAVIEEFGDREREDDACVLVARVVD
ncbi:SpoIIE family protein phosphatase [Streptomyces sp. NPDC002490]|uniref:PP2C family protein-serine/threonine phosphatase n=1 Tax=Streptomyces sp. NPDC002490 TaxID=3154416 RepID=UPI003322069D